MSYTSALEKKIEARTATMMKKLPYKKYLPGTKTKTKGNANLIKKLGE